LKPATVLLDDDLEPKIADFGSSKYVDIGGTLEQSRFDGTPLYTAPEMDKEDRYHFSVDVYAYGMLAFYVLTGHRPFARIKTIGQLVLMVTRGGRPEIPAELDQRWRELIEECWSQERTDRPTFEMIVTRMGNANFVGQGVHQGALLEYQQKLLLASIRSSKPWALAASDLTIDDVKGKQ
jgi:serine/threonine protein kinase